MGHKIETTDCIIQINDSSGLFRYCPEPYCNYDFAQAAFSKKKSDMLPMLHRYSRGMLINKFR